MKTIVIKIEDTIYERLKAFLETLPKEKIQIVEEPDIPFIDDEEQKEIENILKEPSVNNYGKTKSLDI